MSYYLEYESDSDRVSDILLTLEEASCLVLTQGKRTVTVDSHPKGNTIPTQEKRENESNSSPTSTNTPHILKKAYHDSAFDIVESCKASRIQISHAEYLRMNPGELNKLIEYVHQSSLGIAAKQINEVKTLGDNETIAKKTKEPSKGKKPEVQTSNKREEIVQPDKVSPEPSYNHKLDPFYVSLFLHGLSLATTS